MDRCASGATPGKVSVDRHLLVLVANRLLALKRRSVVPQWQRALDTAMRCLPQATGPHLPATRKGGHDGRGSPDANWSGQSTDQMASLMHAERLEARVVVVPGVRPTVVQ
jgi:hypothetical protein